MKNSLAIYCVTDKDLDFFRDLDYKLDKVGKNSLSENYIKCDKEANLSISYPNITLQRSPNV